GWRRRAVGKRQQRWQFVISLTWALALVVVLGFPGCNRGVIHGLSHVSVWRMTNCPAGQRTRMEQVHPAIGWGAGIPEFDLLLALRVVVAHEQRECSQFRLRLGRSWRR